MYSWTSLKRTRTVPEKSVRYNKVSAIYRFGIFQNLNIFYNVLQFSDKCFLWKSPFRMSDWTLSIPQMIRLLQQIVLLWWFLYKSYPYAYMTSGLSCGLFLWVTPSQMFDWIPNRLQYLFTILVLLWWFFEYNF